jgi:histidine ammonia-lyase
MPSAPAVTLDDAPLTPELVERVARSNARVQISSPARARLAESRKRLESILADGEPYYGINTGFGSFSRQRIGPKDLAALQVNLIRSHAAGVGKPLPTDVVRAMLLLLAGSLSRGLSGVRPSTVEAVVGMLNAGITPVVPETGSCGASGDLAPLAHAALALIGEGEVTVKGRTVPAARALKAAGLRPVTLSAKEGLALINGTHLMAAQGALFVQDFQRVFDAALIAAAMSIDACRATDAFLDTRVHHAREQLGQAVVAARLRALIAGSRIIPSHTLNDPRVQDPYSLRCAPQVMGAAWEAFQYVASCIDAELGAVTDNPLIFPGADGKAGSVDVISAGNFHGMPLAIPLDVAAIACAHVAGIAERRIYHMLSGFDPETGLPPYLSPGPGLHSGLMIAQYTAAACCNEIITLCTPASVSNLSTSAGMEDYNSFGPRSAAKARRALELTTQVVAIELLSASEALEHHRPLTSGKPIEAAHRLIRKAVPRLKADRPPAPDAAAIAALITDGAFSGLLPGPSGK